MKQEEDKINYKRNYEISLIVSLLICLVSFLIFPELKNFKKEIPYFAEPVITVLDIPNTIQSSQNHLAPPPSPVISSFLIPIDEPEILDDLKIHEYKQNTSTGELGINSPDTRGNTTSIYEASSFLSVPRQLVEVIPEKVDGAEGAIKMKLLIGKDGYVLKHEILANSTNKNKCVTFVINAVYKSRWQPVLFDGEKVEYWLEKTYTFN
jgi:hypothetical protein